MDLPRAALLTASEASYARQASPALATSRWLAPLLPRTALLKRLLRKAGQRRNKMAKASRSPPAGANPFREASAGATKSRPLIENGFVTAKYWDPKTGQPTLNLPAYKFPVVSEGLRDGAKTIVATSHIGERVVFWLSRHDPETVSDCRQYIIGF
jgi:hypothetical protein